MCVCVCPYGSFVSSCSFLRNGRRSLTPPTQPLACAAGAFRPPLSLRPPTRCILHCLILCHRHHLATSKSLKFLAMEMGGTVYKVRYKRTSAIYALKAVHSSSDQISCRQARREMDILRRTDSPYVVQFHGFFEKPSGDVAILLEYMDWGTLNTLLKKSGTFSESQLATVARQVLNGLTYLHSNKIIHRDIKPSNLLVNRNMEVRISDFGVSKVMCRTLDACNSYVGTCAYMSPERFDPDRYGGNYNGYAADIWSLGLTLFELYVGHFQF